MEENIKALCEALKQYEKIVEQSIKEIKTFQITLQNNTNKIIAEPHRSEDEDSKGLLEIFEPIFIEEDFPKRGQRIKLNLYEDHSGLY